MAGSGAGIETEWVRNKMAVSKRSSDEADWYDDE